MTNGRPGPELGEVVSIIGPDGATATVARHGGHVVSWRTADGLERLFVSDRATIAAGAAIRGGIPVCFPQFAGLGPLPKHGFARTSTWTPVGPSTLALDVGTDAWPGWPHPCRLTIDVVLGPSTLTTTLRVVNTGGEPFAFTGALHTYLACHDVTAVTVSGLDGRAIHGGAQVAGDVRFGDGSSDVDLAVLEVTGPIRVDGLERPGGAAVVCTHSGFRDAVVWNVGSTLGVSMGDLGAGQWRNYVCVEAAAVGRAVLVEPADTWVGSQALVVS